MVFSGSDFLSLFPAKSHASRLEMGQERYSAICRLLTVYEKPFGSDPIIPPK
jgi:hypothetical protein